MTVIDLNEICKIIYYKYKVFHIIGVKQGQSFNPHGLNTEGISNFIKLELSFKKMLKIFGH